MSVSVYIHSTHTCMYKYMAHVCSRMLTYAHVCSRMLTYAHVCSRMLRADVAGRLRRTSVLALVNRRVVLCSLD